MSKLRTLSFGLLVLVLAPWALAGPRSSWSSSSPNREPPAVVRGVDETQALVSGLIEALKDSDPVVVQNVSTALACLGPKGVPALIEALSHQEKNVRAKAAEVLGRLASLGQARNIMPALLKALKDKEVEVRRAAAAAIAMCLGCGQPTPVPCPAYGPACTTLAPAGGYASPSNYAFPPRAY
jgi:HEAT repeat protein